MDIRAEVEKAAVEMVKSGAFDTQLFSIIEDTIRKGPDDGLSEIGFILKMTVELIDRSEPRLSFKTARDYAGRAYSQFLADNSLKFGANGWDWSGRGARIVAAEYEIDHWERAA